MDGFVVHEVAADIAVQVLREMPALSASLDQEVQRLWRKACEADGAQLDGSTEV